MTTISKALVLAMAVSGVTAMGVAQTVQKPKFDVATIKTSSTEASQMGMGVDASGRFVATGASLTRLATFAYGLRSNQVVGGPKWVDSDLYDVIATVENPPDRGAAPSVVMRNYGPYRLMVRSLLADRFNLKAHPETQQLPVYWLETDKRGIKVQPVSGPAGIQVGLGHIKGPISMESLSQFLTGQLGRLVINRTGLVGFYDVTLDFMPELNQTGTIDSETVRAQSADTWHQACSRQSGSSLDWSWNPPKLRLKSS